MVDLCHSSCHDWMLAFVINIKFFVLVLQVQNVGAKFLQLWKILYNCKKKKTNKLGSPKLATLYSTNLPVANAV